MQQDVQETLLRYFTPQQVPELTVVGNVVRIREVSFTLDPDQRSITWAAAPDEPWLNEQLSTLPRDRATWALVAFVKVRYFDDPSGVIARARSGTLYDEDYYTRRGGGSPYVGYPRQDSGHDTSEHFRLLAAEIVARFGVSRTLDAGCATGLLVRALASAGCDAHGIDVSTWAVENSVAANVTHGTLLDLPFENDTFDLVTSQDVMEHIHPEDLPRALAQQARVTREGGHLVHFIPFYSEYPEPIQIDAHLATADRPWWMRLLKSTPGLTIVQEPGEGNQWDYTDGILSRYVVLQVTK